MAELELWGGVESTLNRVGDTYFSQCEKSGHLIRPSDLELFASLGIKKIRYPCLWETVSPAHPGEFDWSWLDERLGRLRELGIGVVAGFLHHGSGPRYTSLVDEAFPEKLARYARAFAERYPWVEDYTPVNEPLTTARFSCLYGHWYPHHASDASFVRAMFLQAKATVLAMAAVRAVNPNARLIQTEDFGRTQSTAPLAYQRDFENSRRWMTFDLLRGEIHRQWESFNYVKFHGLTEPDWRWLEDHPTPPDLLGLNHYPLSNRYLDHRLDLFDASTHGGNGRDRYADVGAADTELVQSPEPADLFREAWDRYRTPLAITEVHVRGHREGQMQWLLKIWQAARTLSAEGAGVRAVTAWSLLGTFDWNSLCTRNDMFYEPGVFDLRNIERRPRPTVLSHLITELAGSADASHHLFREARPLLIVGDSMLSRAFSRLCHYRKIPFAQVDFAGARHATEEKRPWALIDGNPAAGSVELAGFCAITRISFVTFAFDWAFKDERETAGVTQEIRELHPDSLIINTSAFFGPWDDENFLTRSLHDLHRGTPVFAAGDLQVSPTYLPDLVHATLDLLLDGVRGTVPLTNEGRVTWGEWIRLAAAHAPTLDPALIIDKPASELGYRPAAAESESLPNRTVRTMPAIEDALDRYFAQSENINEIKGVPK